MKIKSLAHKLAVIAAARRFSILDALSIIVCTTIGALFGLVPAIIFLLLSIALVIWMEHVIGSMQVAQSTPGPNVANMIPLQPNSVVRIDTTS